MKKILIISPFFRPFTGVGANRMDSLADYLNKKQYDIKVVKNSNRSYRGKILNNIKNDDMEIISVEAEDNFLKNYLKYKKIVARELKKVRFDCVIVSVGPYYTLPLIKLIGQKFHTKIILDIRDLWANEPLISDDTSILKNIIKDCFFQKRAIKNADYVTVPSEGTKKLIEQHYGRILSKKCYSINNGYDERQLTDEIYHLKMNKCSSNSFRLCMFGKFFEYLNELYYQELIEALAMIRQEKKLEVIQVGFKEKEFECLLKSRNIEYFSTGYYEYLKGIIYLKKNAHAFLMSNDLTVGYGTKVYDYIFCNKPIILIGNGKTELSTFLTGFENAFVCSKREEIETAINYIVNKKISHLYEKENILEYSRAYQNNKFEKLILASEKSENNV